MSSRARSTATWRRETSASSCASTRRPSWRRSATNDLIGNFKKPPHLRGNASWIYKERAIERLAAELAAALDLAWLAVATLVPIPASRTRTDPQHDDRMLRLLHRLEHHLEVSRLAAHRLPARLDAHRLGAGCLAADPLAASVQPGVLDIRELLVQRRSIPPVHAAPGRPTPTALAALYEIDETLASPPPRALGLFDDVLTTGAHFKAAQQVLLARFPGTPIAGIFLARTPRSPFPPEIGDPPSVERPVPGPPGEGERSLRIDCSGGGTS